MAHNRILSRREFLTLVGGAASATVLGACASPQATSVPTEVPPTAAPTATPTPIPTPTEIPPTPTPVVVVEPDGFEMTLVEPGSFEMGSEDGLSSERPVHTVSITKPFYMAKYLVTFEHYDEFCAETGSARRSDQDMGRESRPALVKWTEAVKYCNWLSERAGLTSCYSGAALATRCDFAASGYRLATEAEWEYAARGGSRSLGYAYAGSDNPDDVAWYIENSDIITHPVGQKEPNELGLYDMSGNQWEWCWDWYQKKYYESSPSSDPIGPELASTGFRDTIKVVRGGNFNSPVEDLRLSLRNYNLVQAADFGDAIRLVRGA